MQKIKKEAQALTKLKEFVLPTGRRKTLRVSPVRFVGKELLRMRSPDIYAEALDKIEEIDQLLREVVSNQNITLAEMDSWFGSKRGLSSPNFAKSGLKFIRQQAIIIGARNKLDSLFKGKGIQQEIERDIGKTPEKEHDYSKTEDMEGKLNAISSMYNKLCKQAYMAEMLGGAYWKSRTKSGREFVKRFNTVFSKFKQVHNSNLQILKNLDELLDIGDPGEYANAMKRFVDFNTLQDAAFNTAWGFFHQYIETENKEFATKNFMERIALLKTQSDIL